MRVIVIFMRCFKPKHCAQFWIFQHPGIISTFALIFVQCTEETHACMGDFVRTVPVFMIVHQQDPCKLLPNPVQIHRINLNYSCQICCSWTFGQRVQTFQRVDISNADNAQIEKARFCQNSAILVLPLWFMKMSMSASILLLVNHLKLWSWLSTS